MLLLLIIIYIIFISLGLPDSMLGTAWPVMCGDLHVNIGFASIVSMITLFSTSAISFVSGKYIRKYGTFKLTFVSVLFTIAGMLGIALSPNIWVVCLFSVILGMGGGAIDAALNAYVAKHFSTRHMSWLHAFWGVGVSLSPVLLAPFLKNANWRLGYIAIMALQSLLALFVFINRKQWLVIPENFDLPAKHKQLTTWQILCKKGLLSSIACSGMYSALEFTLGTWCASFLVFDSGQNPENAALFVAVYYAGITLSRILTGFISEKYTDNRLLQGGAVLALFGIAMLFFKNQYIIMAAMFCIGMGYGPIYPAQLHRIPQLFGHNYAADIIGFHMAGSYTMGFLVQNVVGFVADKSSFVILPYTLLACCALLFVFNQTTIQRTK